MGNNDEDLPHWARIIIDLVFAGIIVWAIVPGEILHISLCIALVIIGGAS